MRHLILLVPASLIAGTLLGLATTPEPASAGTAVRLDLPQLIEHADLAFEGVVVSASTLDLRERGRLETEFLMDVERTFWGPDEPTRAIRLPGGQLSDGTGMMVPGVPSLELGERVVLFLTEPNGDGMRMPVGLSQGKVRIVSVPGATRIAVGAEGCSIFVDPDTGELGSEGGASLRDYAEFIADVEAAVGLRSALEEED